MKAPIAALLALGLVSSATPGSAQAPGSDAAAGRQRPTNWWSQAGGENGPTRIVWAAQKSPQTVYSGPNKPIWHIADILKAHKGQARWEQKVLLNRDFGPADRFKQRPDEFFFGFRLRWVLDLAESC